MHTATTICLVVFLCLSGSRCLAQQFVSTGYVIEVRLHDRGGIYTNFFPSFAAIQQDAELQKLGLQCYPASRSLRLKGNGLLTVNGVRQSIENAPFEGMPRHGVELELQEFHPDTLLVSLVFWKNGERHIVAKEYKTYRKITDAMRPLNTRPALPQDHHIRLNHPVSLDSFTTFSQKTWHPAQLHGKVTVLHFWHTGCKPCEAEIPFLNQLAER